MKPETAVLISIRPEWARLILCGEKTLEIRKSRPKLEEPFTCYIYQCLPKCGDWNGMDGRVVGDFVCQCVSTLIPLESFNPRQTCISLRACSCLSAQEVWKYSCNGKKILYGWHISELTVYKKPLKLSDFLNLNGEPIRRAPQSWQYVQRRNHNETNHYNL